MDDEASSDVQKHLSESPMDTDEGILINENSNGLSHLLTDGELNSVDAVAADESSTSNQAFLNSVDFSTGSVGDYLENNTDGFNTDSFDVGDNAINFPSDSMNNVLSDSDSRLSATFKMSSDTEVDNFESVSKDKQTFEMQGNRMIEDESNKDVENEYTNDNDKETVEVNENIKDSEIDKPEVESHAIETSEKIQTIDANDKCETEKQKEDLENENRTDNRDEDNESMESILMKKIVTSMEKKFSAMPTSAEDKGLDNKNTDVSEKSENEESKENLVTSNIENAKTERQRELENENTTDNRDEDNESMGAILMKEIVTSMENNFSEMSTSAEDKVLDKKNTDVSEKSENESKENLVTSNIDKAKVGGAEETEVVSEDELPAVQKPSVKDAENVSDDELPGPKHAELPADTEVVSEDELPSSKKETKESRKRKTQEGDGYDPGSPTSESETSSKKIALSKNGECKPVSAEKRSSIDEKPKKKVLPELDKYWKVVNDNPADFTGWTYLLQYVDQETDVEAAREAYDAFLSHYPYCYGYWRKYADYEKRKGSKKKCLEVLERGLKSIPLSVDLWIHYLNHIKATRTEDHVFIRAQYERAIEACGLEFRSDRLWESYIKWEAENGSALNVTNIYDRLLATPTLGYATHFDNFQEHVMSEPVAGVVSSAELVSLRADVRAAAPTQAPPPADLPPGEDEPLDHIASEEEANAIKERIIAARRKIHKATGDEVTARWTFEEGIKRPYFHVKPLERCQLKNWKTYLEWEKQHGSLKRALVLHERCLIACALYEEFWIRLIKFLEEKCETNPELVAVEREVLERACTIHHLDKPELHLHWAHFEELHGQPARAAEILDRIEKSCAGLVQVQYRRVNLERRRGDYDKCIQLYESYIASAKNKAIASALAIKYARFLFHVKKDPAAAMKALDEAVTRDPLNARLYMQSLDLALHTPDTTYDQLEEILSRYEKQEGAELETSAALASRRRELAEELGGSAAARTAQQHARTLHKQLRKRARKDKHEPAQSCPTESAKKKETCTATASTAAASNNSAYYGGGGGGGGNSQQYEQSYAQPYQPPWGYQQPAPYQHHPHHPHQWPQYPNYY